MKIIATTGNEEVATVYILELENGKLVECVESIQPPRTRQEKWVLLVSTMFGCPVNCKMCDAGGHYEGNLTAEQILAQIDFLVYKRFPDGHIPSDEFKIQFARMGEPALNFAVLETLSQLASRYQAAGLLPSLSTIAPAGRDKFFDQLANIKNQHYSHGRFQFQFSIHTTDPNLRNEIIPVKKWDFTQIAEYGERFYRPGDKKITLNFALARGMPVDPVVLRRYFDPDKFLIKITPLNPTYRAVESNLESYIDRRKNQTDYPIVNQLSAAGYQVIVSIGESEENLIGSNCGQYVRRHLNADNQIQEGYTYAIRECREDQALRV
jgi:23S rRNA (adenine2503-C2)-methyltransferase